MAAVSPQWTALIALRAKLASAFPIRKYFVLDQQFDNLKARASQNFDQNALPTRLVFAETTSWNSALATDILHTVPLLRLRRRRPLRNHPALALLRAWKVQELWRHDSQCHWQD